MILRRFTSADALLSPAQVERRRQIRAEMARVAKASEQQDPPEQRRQVLDVSDLADAWAAGGTMEHATAWRCWDWIRWGTPWLLLGLGLGLVADLIVRAVA